MGPWKLTLLRWTAGQDWALDLLDERQARGILRSLAGRTAQDRTAALRQLDRLPEWLDLLMSWLDAPEDEETALAALTTAPRLAGPYSQLALRSYLEREVQRALAGDVPADALWAVALRIDRWIRKHPTLARVCLAPPERELTLAAAAHSLRDLARRLEASSVDDPLIRSELAAWPEPPAGHPRRGPLEGGPACGGQDSRPSSASSAKPAPHPVGSRR